MKRDGSAGPLPPNFRAVFIERGWRGVERMFGATSNQITAWIEASGGDVLRAERAANQGGGRICGSAMQVSAEAPPQRADLTVTYGGEPITFDGEEVTYDGR